MNCLNLKKNLTLEVKYPFESDFLFFVGMGEVKVRVRFFSSELLFVLLDRDF